MKTEDKKIHEQFVRAGKSLSPSKDLCLYMIAEIAEKEIWKKAGYPSIYVYAAKHAGLSFPSVRKALATFDRIRGKENLMRAASRNSMEKVAIVSKIATDENQKDIAQLLPHLSSHELQEYVKDYKKASVYI